MKEGDADDLQYDDILMRLPKWKLLVNTFSFRFSLVNLKSPKKRYFLHDKPKKFNSRFILFIKDS